MKNGPEVFTITSVTAGRALAFAALVALLSSTACEPAQAPTPQTVSLRVHGAPPQAAVIIDDNPIGTFDLVAAHGVALPPGLHRITVAANGYFPWDRVVEANVGSGPITLQVTLTPIPE